MKSRKLTDIMPMFDATKVDSIYVPNLALARAQGMAARKLGVTSIKDQYKNGDRHALVIIDAEVDFMETGRLPVPGAFADMGRLCERLIRGVDENFYTDLICTIDMHPAFSIHSDLWWEDEEGNLPDVSLPVMMDLVEPDAKYPFNCIYLDGRAPKRFRPRTMRQWTVGEYAPHLKATGQGPIWVFATHCRAGSDGINIVPALAEVIEFACAARDIQPIYMFKGMIAQVDWFGPFRPCKDVPDHPQGGLQTAYLDIIRGCKTTDIAGEAEDFCVRAGTGQVLAYYSDSPDVLASIRFIGNCTSPIVPDSADNPHNANFRAEMVAKGVRIINHDEAFRK